MSAAAKRAPRLAPVGDEEHRRLGLLPGWKFFHAPRGLACSLCGRPAEYLCDGTLAPRCEKHGRDF